MKKEILNLLDEADIEVDADYPIKVESDPDNPTGSTITMLKVEERNRLVALKFINKLKNMI